MAATLIALCGAPGSGKSEVQHLLFKRWDVQPVDDGHPLRHFAMVHCGLRLLDVSTQAGKAKDYEFPGGRTKQVRKFLGELGDAVEAILGPDAIPAMALRQVHLGRHARGQRFCFGSVRRSQGHFYKRNGAVVVELVRAGCEVVNEFDAYDRDCVDHTINNNGTLAELEKAVVGLFGPLLS